MGTDIKLDDGSWAGRRLTQMLDQAASASFSALAIASSIAPTM